MTGGEHGEWYHKSELTVKYFAGNGEFEGLNGI